VVRIIIFDKATLTMPLRMAGADFSSTANVFVSESCNLFSFDRHLKNSTREIGGKAPVQGRDNGTGQIGHK
jgi:hypothetical protein